MNQLTPQQELDNNIERLADAYTDFWAAFGRVVEGIHADQEETRKIIKELQANV